METLLPFFLVLFAGLLFSALFRKIHLPWVVALIVAGIIIGPYGFQFLEVDSTLEFIGNIGLIFLMFMAGLETQLSSLKESRTNTLKLSFVNAIVPALVGVAIGLSFGYSIQSAFFIGIVFMSSSIAIVIPSLEANKLFHSRIGTTIISTTIVTDVLSLIFFLFLLQSINPVSTIPLPIFYILLTAVLVFMRWLLPKIEIFFERAVFNEEALFQKDLRVVFMILIGTVVSFELLQLHPVLAGFFAGLVLSDSIKSQVLKNKLRAISYGIFIPTFFVVVGAQTNISILFSSQSVMILIGVMLLGSILSKVASGWFGGRLIGYSSSQSLLIGVATVPQLSTPLAVVAVGTAGGFIPTELGAAFIILSITTTVIGPIFIRLIAHLKRKDFISFINNDLVVHEKEANSL